jgi:hypothetical protein
MLILIKHNKLCLYLKGNYDFMRIFILMIVLVSCVNSQSLDTLMKKALVAEIRAGKVSGYVFSHTQQQVKLIPPNKLFNTHLNVAPLNNFSVNYEVLQKEVNDLRVEQAKTSFIIESLIKQSESHTKSNDFILKLIELVIGGIVSIVTAYLISKIKLKK